MKKLLALLLALFALISRIDALPVGNPIESELLLQGIFCEDHICDENCFGWEYGKQWNFRFGFYGDYVFNRFMQVDSSENHGSFYSTEIYTNAAFLSFALFERINIFATLGTTEIDIETDDRTLGSGLGVNDPVYIETDTSFSWSLGLKAILWQCNHWGLGAEFQYFQARPQLDFLRDQASAPTYFSDNDLLKYQEWQIGLGAAYYYYFGCGNALVPYLAIKWAQVKMDMGNREIEDNILYNAKNIRNLGYALGLSFVANDRAIISVEGRFTDEEALYINSQFRF